MGEGPTLPVPSADFLISGDRELTALQQPLHLQVEGSSDGVEAIPKGAETCSQGCLWPHAGLTLLRGQLLRDP